MSTEEIQKTEVTDETGKYRFKAGDRIRLTVAMSNTLPFLKVGAVGTVQETASGFLNDLYFLAMDPAGDFSGEDLDYWLASDDMLEAEQ